MSARLRPFGFVLVKDGHVSTFTFYAESRQVARSYAMTWAKRTGWTLEGRS
jgi:hypothetical protein